MPEALFFQAVLTLLLLVAMIYDFTKFIIPNWISLLIIALYPAFLWLSPAPIDWINGLIAAGIVLAGGFALYALNKFGAGDAKLMTACALWTGLDHLLEFLFATAILGGILALALMILRRVIFWGLPNLATNDNFPRVLKVGENMMPYGLAIAGGMLITIWIAGLPGLAAPF